MTCANAVWCKSKLLTCVQISIIRQYVNIQVQTQHVEQHRTIVHTQRMRRNRELSLANIFRFERCRGDNRIEVNATLLAHDQYFSSFNWMSFCEILRSELRARNTVC